ncbi:HNH endonuclease [Halobaculum marinum]|uniref:HNH endonuclease n=1 Tax=Halobaculum marinum TaxID=3031996 RepID=A0ABD5WT10_9EURY|nr:HNH endonuclease [Halobaculum sp. DT55]
MPVQAISDWVDELRKRANDRGIRFTAETDGRIFHFVLGEDPGIIGKVRTSEGQSREFRDDQGVEYIWHRYNREQEQAESDDPRRVVNITLDVWDTGRYDLDQDHFLFLTEEMVTAGTYSKGDQKIRVLGSGEYDGPLARHVDDWDAVFSYAVNDSIDDQAESSRSEDSENWYRVGARYYDSTDPERDEFQSWIKGPLESGIGNSAGIRVVEAKTGPQKGEVTAVVIVSSELDDPDGFNRWDDEFDLNNGLIHYWGDAKRSGSESDEPIDEDEFPGNQQLRAVHRLNTTDQRTRYPPILVFRRPESGVVEFNGLCVIEQVELDEFEDNGVPTPNYLYHLGVLDVEEVPLSWIHQRTETGSDALAPDVWHQWVESGEVTPGMRYGEASVTPEPVDDTTIAGPSDTTDTAGRISTGEQTQVRISQEFRNETHDTYGECILTEISDPRLLQVAHILGRADHPEIAEDIGNVVLLTHTHHAAFDADLWTFDANGRLWVSPEFESNDPWLQNTLTLREGAQIPALKDSPVRTEFIQERNSQLDWWPVDD